MVTIPDYVDAFLAGREMDGKTPVELAETLHNHASIALEKLNMIGYQSEKETRLTMGDIKAMALSGHYYAEKILGAVNLQFYRITGEKSYQEASIAHLVEAAEYWRQYADVAANQYEPQVLARNSRLDWIDLIDDVLEDIDIAREGR